MSISHPGSSLPALVRDGRRFWATPQGQALHHAERACLGPVCEGVFGVHSLELGMGDPLADMCPVRHPMRWSPTRELAQGPSTLVCTPDALPLPDGCLSLVIVHHLLEVVPDPHHLLQEAARVTRDDGRLILFGWMPLSAGALPRVWPTRRRRLPWCGHWRTPGRLRDWLAFVDFRIERVDYCGFHLPGGMPRNAALETLGRRYNLPLGDSYMIQASRRSQLAQTQGGRLQFGRPFGGSALGATRVGQPRLSPPQERMTEVD
ncbi:class I SAM-dependent methyltransferase [Halomonas mongoliensis]|uniref:class I SAM-dependent methyltransferase n=1 Tax=Halomonas mongoliensis TaxID=321265 RepID=UPI00403B0341